MPISSSHFRSRNFYSSSSNNNNFLRKKLFYIVIVAAGIIILVLLLNMYHFTITSQTSSTSSSSSPSSSSSASFFQYHHHPNHAKHNSKNQNPQDNDDDEDKFSKIRQLDDQFLETAVPTCPPIPPYGQLRDEDRAAEARDESEVQAHRRGHRIVKKEATYRAGEIYPEGSAPALCHRFLKQLLSKKAKRIQQEQQGGGGGGGNDEGKNQNTYYDLHGGNDAGLKSSLTNWWLPYSKGGRILHSPTNHDAGDFIMKPGYAKLPKKDRDHPKSASEIALATLFATRKDTDVKPKMNAEDAARDKENEDKRNAELDAAASAAHDDGARLYAEETANSDYLSHYISTSYLAELKMDAVSHKKWWKRMYFMSFVNKALYTLRRKYDLIVEGNSIVDKSRNSAAWSKLKVMMKWLDDYSWILWVDSDSFIMNHKIPLATFLPRRVATTRIRPDANNTLASADENDSDFYMYKGEPTGSAQQKLKSLFIAKDYRSWNTGVFFLRGNDLDRELTTGEVSFSKDFLRQMWDVTDADALKHTQFHDQGAMILVTDEKYIANAHDPEKRRKVRENQYHIYELEANIINAYPAPVLAMSPIDDMKWQKWVFAEGTSVIVHFPSCTQFVTCPGWMEYLFSTSIRDNVEEQPEFFEPPRHESGEAAEASVPWWKRSNSDIPFPPPPHILANRERYDVRIGEGSFRILGKGLR